MEGITKEIQNFPNSTSDIKSISVIDSNKTMNYQNYESESINPQSKEIEQLLIDNQDNKIYSKSVNDKNLFEEFKNVNLYQQ